MIAEPDITTIAALIGENSRAAMLVALLDGRALPAGELAFAANISAQTASAHLSKLVAGELLILETHGRHRYYKIANGNVARAIEALQTIAPIQKTFQPRPANQTVELRTARTCYDHLAGRLGVELTQNLLDQEILKESGADYEITPCGTQWLLDFGIDLAGAGRGRRALARQCLDWSERRHHLAGELGAMMLKRLFELDWLARLPGCRAVRLTGKGRVELRKLKLVA